MRYLSLLLCIAVLSSGCGSDGDGPELLEPTDLLPGDGEISGWHWDGAPSEASDQSSLYDLINGGAAEFVERGFVSGVLQQYGGSIAGSSSTLEVFIADQGSPSNADNIYDKRAERLPFAVPFVDEHGECTFGDAEEARIDEATTLDSVILDFWQDRFYIQVTIDNRQADPDLARQTAMQFGENMSRAITG